MSSDLIPQQYSQLLPQALEKLLLWLDIDKKRAEEKYGQIRAGLLELFESNGCKMIHEMADEAIVQAMKKVRKTGASAYDADSIFRKAGEKVLRDYFKRWASTKEALDRLLNWLDPDAEAAAKKYERIHLTLSAIFRSQGLTDAEGLADETINRVIRKLPQIEKNYSGNPALYFSGVAKKICQESIRRNISSNRGYAGYGRQQSISDSYQDLQQEYEDQQHRCFNRCLQSLKSDDRELLLGYYQEEKREKISTRKDLAKSFGITAGNLRVRRYRIYNSLVKCIQSCLKEE